MNQGTPGSISQHYVDAFNKGIQQQFQQEQSVTDALVMHDYQNSENAYADRIGAFGRPKRDTTRFADNPMTHAEFDRRQLNLVDFDDGVPIDPKDLKRVAENPTHAITMAMLAAFKREKDIFFFERLYGTSYTKKGGLKAIDYVTDGSTTSDGHVRVGGNSAGVTRPITSTTASGRNGRLVRGSLETEGITVGSRFNGFGDEMSTDPTGLTIAKLRGLRKVLLRLEAVKEDTMVPCLINSTQWENLLKEEPVINSDYATHGALVSGKVDHFLGYKFIHTELVPQVGGETRVTCILPESYTQQNGEVMGNIWELSGKKKIPYVYYKMCLGGTRMWGECTADIRCAE